MLYVYTHTSLCSHRIRKKSAIVSIRANLHAQHAEGDDDVESSVLTYNIFASEREEEHYILLFVTTRQFSSGKMTKLICLEYLIKPSSIHSDKGS